MSNYPQASLSTTTLVIVLEASQWPYASETFPQSEAFRAAATKMRSYFLKDFGIPAEHILWLFDTPLNASAVNEQISEFLEERAAAARQVIFYYTGHAKPTQDFGIYLALRDTRDYNPEGTSLRIKTLADTISSRGGLLARYYLLDCCFSARAIPHLQGMSEADLLESVLASEEERTGGYAALFSADKAEPSVLLPDESNTFFSEALWRVLSQERKQYLSLRAVCDLTNSQLQVLYHAYRVTHPHEVHRPPIAQLYDENAASLPLFPGKSVQLVEVKKEASKESDRSQEHLPIFPERSAWSGERELLKARARPHPRLPRARTLLVMLLCLALLLSGGTTWLLLGPRLAQILHSSGPPTSQATAVVKTYQQWVTTYGIQFGFDAAHTHWNPFERVLKATNLTRVKILWSYPTGGIVDSTAAVANGMVYVGSWKGILYAFDEACHSDCQPLWSFQTKDTIISSPAVVNGMVYVGSWDGSLYAFNATCRSNCQPLWSYATGSYIGSSPAVANGMVYIGSYDHKFYAFDATCHSACQPLWSYATGNSIYSSAAIANGMIYVGSTDHKVYAFSATCRSACQPLWSYATKADVGSSPAVANGMVYVGSYDHKFYAFNATCHSACQPLWSFTTGDGISSSPTVANGVVYIGSWDGKLYAFDATCRSTCQPLWSFAAGDDITSSPAIANGMIYFGSIDHKFYALGLK